MYVKGNWTTWYFVVGQRLNVLHVKLTECDLLLNVCFAEHHNYDLVGAGACRGPNWTSKEWPKDLKGVTKASECYKTCWKIKGCTGFHLHGEGCSLVGHDDIQAASGLKGNCFKIKKHKRKDDSGE